MLLELRQDVGCCREHNTGAVGIYRGVKDTVVLVFQKNDDRLGTLTTTIPLSIPAFKAFVDVVEQTAKGIEKEEL